MRVFDISTLRCVAVYRGAIPFEEGVGRTGFNHSLISVSLTVRRKGSLWDLGSEERGNATQETPAEQPFS